MNFISIIRELQIGKRTIFFSVLGQTYYFLIAFFLFKSELINRLDENFIFDIKFYQLYDFINWILKLCHVIEFYSRL